MRDKKKKQQSIALSHLAASFKHLLGGVFKKDSFTSDVGFFLSFFSFHLNILFFLLTSPLPPSFSERALRKHPTTLKMNLPRC